ncbi:MAG: hypothetical protein CVV05_13105 [Gammaproteobacteria bacterium HGW-Gammaproteobacteria-1]|jgi:hypothetical protein|nr:MAG: hypothetical protein CVV05_13105 [Gammaproteobacteria bacterium HGW-Gammaproteobacteria-1]
MSTNNLHRLFQPASTDKTLLNALTLTADEDAILRKARTQVRETLRRDLPRLIKQALPGIQTIETPRFITQGSFAYKTINRHCHPKQQIDMDDGCYLPLSFAKEFEVGHASNLFFQAVELVLTPLAKANGWKLVPKDTCTRLEIDSTKHIDIPLYAIPDADFKKMLMDASVLEYAALKGQVHDHARAVQWSDLPRNKVLLAIRGGDWRPSDPRPVIRWVENQVATKTEQWRRLIRYLKAWRDYQWPSGGPTSICLMAAMDQVFLRPNAGRDDLALLDIVRRLPQVFAGDIYNPAEPTARPEDRELLSRRLDEEPGLRRVVQEKLREFERDLNMAINGNVSPMDACNLVSRHLGPRIPVRPDWVLVESVAQQVRSTAPRVSVVAPLIGTTKSG